MIVDPEPSCALEAAAGQADPRTFCRRWGLVLAEDRALLRIPRQFRDDPTGCEAGWTDADVLKALDALLASVAPVTRKAWRLVLSGCYSKQRRQMRRGSSWERCYRAARTGRARSGARRPTLLPPSWRCRLAVERQACVSDLVPCA